MPRQFTPEHFDDDREPEQPQKQSKRRRSRRQMNAGCAGSMVYMIAVVGVSLVLSIAALFAANDIFAFVKADAVKEITVSENTSVSSLAKELDDQGVINYHSVFKLYLTLKHQTDTSRFSAGHLSAEPVDGLRSDRRCAGQHRKHGDHFLQLHPGGLFPSRKSVRCCWTTISTEDALDEVLNDYSLPARFPG